MIRNIIVFLILNFAALALGSMFTTNGVSSSWYQELNKAPWTPPGWVFGAAWTLIMIGFAIYMAVLIPKVNSIKLLLGLYSVQWVLNVLWNPVFFYYRLAPVGLIVILMLTLLVGFLLFFYGKHTGIKSVFILPYFVWLIIATSLNAYIVVYN